MCPERDAAARRSRRASLSPPGARRSCIGVRLPAAVCALLAALGSVLPGDDALAQQTRLEPDHLYLWVSPGAPEGAVLRKLGILQYPDTARPGEGVEWITFAFENIYLELLWVADESRFRETWVAYHPPHLDRARWRDTGSSPFGLAFHRAESPTAELPAVFRVTDWWDGEGGYAPDVGPEIPFLMVMGPRYAMPDPIWMTPAARELAANPPGIRRLTDWTLGTPRPPDHEAVDLLVRQGALHVIPSTRHVLELTFDEGRQGRTFDARPDLPLIFHY